MGLGYPAKLGLPIAVEDHPVDVAPRGSVSQRSVLAVLKSTWTVEPIGLYASTRALICPRADAKLAVIPSCDPFASDFSELLIEQPAPDTSPLCKRRQGIEPGLVMRFNWPKKCSFRLFAGVTPLGEEELR